jgi:hypothetical protein
MDGSTTNQYPMSFSWVARPGTIRTNVVSSFPKWWIFGYLPREIWGSKMIESRKDSGLMQLISIDL